VNDADIVSDSVGLNP